MYLVLELRKIKLIIIPVFLSVFIVSAALLLPATNFGAGFRVQESKSVCCLLYYEFYLVIFNKFKGVIMSACVCIVFSGLG